MHLLYQIQKQLEIKNEATTGLQGRSNMLRIMRALYRESAVHTGSATVK